MPNSFEVGIICTDEKMKVQKVKIICSTKVKKTKIWQSHKVNYMPHFKISFAISQEVKGKVKDSH